MAYLEDISNIPYIQLDNEKALLLYAMKIKQGDYNLLSEHQTSYGSNKRYSKRQNRSKSNRNKARSRKSRKKHRKNKRNRKKYKKNKKNNKSKNGYLSNDKPQKAGSSSYLPIVVLNSDINSKENNVPKRSSDRYKYLRNRRRHLPEMYDRDYYDDYFYDYPPSHSSSWYKYRRAIPRFRPRQGYNPETSESRDTYTAFDTGREVKRKKSSR